MNIELKNKKVLVMGLGLHGGGLGAAKWLAEQGAKVTVTDLKTRKQLAKSIKELQGFKIKYVLGRHRIDDFKSADLIIKNPGVPNDSKYLKVAKENKIPIESDISLFFLATSAQVIGITGSKGKSTTTTLIGEILKKRNKRTIVAGNIRVSPLQFLKKIKPDDRVVLELSSWQLEGLAKHQISPHVSVITNLFPEHLNRYRSYADYLRAKALIVKFQTPGDVCVLNRDNYESRQLGKVVLSQRFWFSKKYFAEENGAYLYKGWLYFRFNGKETKIIKRDEIALKGDHNLENVLAAIIVARVNRITVATLRLVIKNFKGVAGRLELIRKFKGVEYYNDTTATAPQATIQSLKALSKKKNIILLAGGADKKSNFKDLVKEIKAKTKAVILFNGTGSSRLEKELLRKDYWAISKANSMSKAISYAQAMVREGDIVLLSPGCSSFGMFINEFDRGDQFVEQVKKLK